MSKKMTEEDQLDYWYERSHKHWRAWGSWFSWVLQLDLAFSLSKQPQPSGYYLRYSSEIALDTSRVLFSYNYTPSFLRV